MIKMIFIAIYVVNVIQMFLIYTASIAKNAFKVLKKTCFIVLNVISVILGQKNYIFIVNSVNDVY
jgi:hypothetical protein